jgi:hypothetical protein
MGLRRQYPRICEYRKTQAFLNQQRVARKIFDKIYLQNIKKLAGKAASAGKRLPTSFFWSSLNLLNKKVTHELRNILFQGKL